MLFSTFLFVMLFASYVFGYDYDRCELAKEFRDVHHIPVEEISDWVCLAQHTLNMNTTLRNGRRYGIFQIFDVYWCASEDGKGANQCELKCSKLLDGDIADDIKCVKKIGFNVWGVALKNNCDNDDYASDCFDDSDIDDTTQRTTTTTSTTTAATTHYTTITTSRSTTRTESTYNQCSLSRELRETHGLPEDEVDTLVCLAQIGSNMDTSKLRGQNYGLFQIPAIPWCNSSFPSPNVCDTNCDNFLDTDLTDDLACVETIKVIQGFNSAWPYSNFEQRCEKLVKNNDVDCSNGYSGQHYSPTQRPRTVNFDDRLRTDEPVIIYDDDDEDKVYGSCQLARELVGEHNLPRDRVGDWVCLAKYASNFQVAARKFHRYGLFQIPGTPWCASGGDIDDTVCGVACNKLLNECLSNDFSCARQIHDIKGFEAWRQYGDNDCHIKEFDLVANCFSLESLFLRLD